MAALGIAAVFLGLLALGCQLQGTATPAPTPEFTQDTSQAIAEGSVRQDATFKFDGLPDSLLLTRSVTLRCPWCWEFTYKFQSAHPGYGDRSGKPLPSAVTNHVAKVVVEKHTVTRATLDGRWDMLTEQFLPDLQPAKVFKGGVLATFRVENDTFQAFTADPSAIADLFALREGRGSAHIPNGTLAEGPGVGAHNAPWSWHLDPSDLHLADLTIEVCDGKPRMVEDNLDYWLGAVKRYCPWAAELVDIQDYR